MRFRSIQAYNQKQSFKLHFQNGWKACTEKVYIIFMLDRLEYLDPKAIVEVSKIP